MSCKVNHYDADNLADNGTILRCPRCGKVISDRRTLQMSDYELVRSGLLTSDAKGSLGVGQRLAIAFADIFGKPKEQGE